MTSEDDGKKNVGVSPTKGRKEERIDEIVWQILEKEFTISLSSRSRVEHFLSDVF